MTTLIQKWRYLASSQVAGADKRASRGIGYPCERKTPRPRCDSTHPVGERSRKRPGRWSDREVSYRPRRPNHQGQGHVRAAGAGDRRAPPELARLLLVVTRDGEADVMTMKAEAANPDTTLRDAVNATLRSVTKHGGNVAWVAAIPAERRQGRRGRTLKRAPANVRCSFHWAATAPKPQNALRRDLNRQLPVLGWR
jgi:hypothetical protein